MTLYNMCNIYSYIYRGVTHIMDKVVKVKAGLMLTTTISLRASS